MAIPREAVVSGVSEKVQWWIGRRRAKLEKLAHGSHAVNPFLWPVIMSMHGFDTFRELAEFQLSGHLVEGHATGFGKLVDEKILGGVFATIKLDKKFRESNPPYNQHEYDNVDHLVPRDSGTPDLLSLKAGRWSIQLGQAVQLNRSFQEIIKAKAEEKADFDDIVVGVFYGTHEGLTDKYQIIRGRSTGATHDVVDISKHVSVLAGRDFWGWLNNGENRTQEWVLEGVQSGYTLDAAENGPMDELFESFISDFAAHYQKYEITDDEGQVLIDWQELLKDING